MSIDITGVTQSISTTYSQGLNKKDSESKTNESNESNEVAAVYEKSANQSQSATYKVNKMSLEERTALVNKLKADQEENANKLTSLVSQMLEKQAGTVSITDDAMWSFLAKGNLQVDEETRNQAIQDISEDGYWGVKQTSQRLFDFASALAGDDTEQMKKMQEAMMQGFEQATKTWGSELPQISQDTIDAANKLFEEYYNSKQETTE